MSLIDETINKITAVDKAFMDKAQARLDSLTKPQGSLGKLEDIARQIVAITEDEKPEIKKPCVCTFAGDHGVTDEGVSAFPKEVTPQMVFNFIQKGAAINAIADTVGAKVNVIDVGVDFDFNNIDGLIDKKVMDGTDNIAVGPAMTRIEAQKCIEVGIELADKFSAEGCDIFCTGEMGIGNTTPSSAVIAAYLNEDPETVTGRGTGIDDKALNNKIKVIKKAIETNKPDLNDGLDLLSKLGGTEIGAIAGLCLGAAKNKKPVVVDGFISTAGALIAYLIEPNVKDYMFASHQSVEPGHKHILAKMDLKPILDLDLRLGEGTGAALSLHIIKTALAVYNNMATFEEASVSGRDDA